jgi:hypothetical protein
MDARIHDLLVKFDSTTEIEYSADFDWADAMQRVRSLQPRLEAILGERLRLDDQIQDATYCADLFVLDEEMNVEGMRFLISRIYISFSNFGDLATIAIGAKHLDRYPLSALSTALEEHGFVPIPAEALDEPYDGKLDRRYGWPATWRDRYFNYT